MVNIDAMPETTEWFCKTLHPSIIDFENLKSNKKSDGMRLIEPDPILFARQFNKSLSIAEKYGVELVNGSIISDQPQFSSCPVGKDPIIVTPDGSINSCYLFPWRWEEKGLDLTVGKITDGEVRLSHEKIMRIREIVRDKPRCSSCYCRWSCAGGCHVDITWPGSDTNYDNFCKQTRIMGVIKILRSLNQQVLLDLFIQDDEQLISVSKRKSDKLKDWSEG
jgi:radical SAM protein with 4Fe4S-binding SPASM domain